MKRVVQAMRLPFISAALIGTSGLLVFLNMPYALAANNPTPTPTSVVQVSLNRPSSVTVGSVLVRSCRQVDSNGRCHTIGTSGCKNLSQQNKPYAIGSFVSGTTLTITRWSSAQCQGKSNPQDQQVTLQGTSQTVTIQNW